MKHVLPIVCTLLILLSAFFSISSHAATTSTSGHQMVKLDDVYTPRGSTVAAYRMTDDLKPQEMIVADRLRQTYTARGAVVLGEATLKYNCHAYAWTMREVDDLDIWVNSPQAYISDGSYIRIDEPEVGCIVVYYESFTLESLKMDESGNISVGARLSYYTYSHSAVVVDVPEGATDLKDLTVESKWGYYDLYRHKGLNCTYADYYEESETLPEDPSDSGIRIKAGYSHYEYYRFSNNNYANKTLQIESPDSPVNAVKEGLWQDADGKIRYYIQGQPQFVGVVSDTKGNFYYIGESCEATAGGVGTISAFRANGLTPEGTYIFDSEGTISDQLAEVVEGEDPLNGVVRLANGKIQILEDGVPCAPGLVEDANGDLYYLDNNSYAIAGRSYYLSANACNGILPAGRYTFDENGKIQGLPELLAGESLVNGLVRYADGKVQFYKNGKATYAGLVKSDEGDYYFISPSLRELRNKKYKVPKTKTNGLLPAGTYTFGPDGKITSLPELLAGTDPFNGLVIMQDGTVQYLVNGVATAAGLVKSDAGDLYFIDRSGKAVTGQSCEITEAETNGWLAAGTYSFDERGRMISTETDGQAGEQSEEPAA